MNLYRMRNIRRVIHLNPQNSPVFAGTAPAQPMGLQQYRARWTRLRAPVGKLGKPPYFLQELHYVNASGHAQVS